MKNFLQNLLIFLSFCLCLLIAFQWHRETKLRQEIQKLNDTIHDKLEMIQSQESAIKRDNEEIKRLDGLKTEFAQTIKSNRTEIAQLIKDREKSDLEVEKGLKQIDAYKIALEQANEAIKRQNEEVAKQNESVKQLSTEHAALVAKYNKVVADFNELAEKWNAVQAAAASNAAAPPTKK